MAGIEFILDDQPKSVFSGRRIHFGTLPDPQFDSREIVSVFVESIQFKADNALANWSRGLERDSKAPSDALRPQIFHHCLG